MCPGPAQKLGDLVANPSNLVWEGAFAKGGEARPAGAPFLGTGLSSPVQTLAPLLWI
jgi:hypothetical protein